jgi:hypothetical protein
MQAKPNVKRPGLSEEDLDKNQEQANAFARDFKALVRKYVPAYPSTESGLDQKEQMRQSMLLYQMQDMTSVFSPFVWSDD